MVAIYCDDCKIAGHSQRVNMIKSRIQDGMFIYPPISDPVGL